MRHVNAKSNTPQQSHECASFELRLEFSLLPDRESLVCLIRTVLWTMRYWELCNEGPPIDTSGKHGFILRNGKIEFGTELGD